MKFCQVKYSLLVLGLISFSSYSQEIKMNSLINVGSASITAPAISGDGSRMVYLSDYSSTGDYVMMMSENKGGWKEPVELPRLVNSFSINYVYGHNLSFDGNTLYFTSRRSGSRKYDIWSSELKNGKWQNPKNLGFTINSDLNEGTPSFTPDGNEVYFCRCTKMDNYYASGCDIYYSRLEKGDWITPVALPPSINAANDLAPRILADGKTLIFASNMPGGKGKFDLYQSRKTDNGWTDPIPLDFANTPEDDLISAARMYGVRLIKGKPVGKSTDNKFQLFETLIPKEFRQENILILDYNLVRDFNANQANLIVQDWNTGKELKRVRIDSGAHHLVLNEGTKYHVLFQPTHLKRSPVSKVYDLEDMTRPLAQRPVFEMTMLERGRVLETEGFRFQATEPFINNSSSTLMDHVSKMVKINADLDIELQLVMTNYIEDTIFVHEDMTEIRIDTTYSTRMDTVYNEIQEVDSALLQNEQQSDSVILLLSVDSTGVIASVLPDSTAWEVVSDTTSLEPSYYLEEVEEMHISKFYHNDRSEKEASELKKLLQAGGVPDDRILITTHREQPVEGKAERFIRIVIR